MRSMPFVKPTSPTVIGTGHGFSYRAAWLMAAVAVILAALVPTVSQHRTVWAAGPEFSITVSDENYETANVSFTISNLPSEVDENNWIAQINYRPTNGQVPDTQWRAGNLDIGSYHFDEDLWWTPPPKSRRWQTSRASLTKDGTDLAFFSGGKGIGGPQNAGLLAGRMRTDGSCVRQRAQP